MRCAGVPRAVPGGTAEPRTKLPFFGSKSILPLTTFPPPRRKKKNHHSLSSVLSKCLIIWLLLHSVLRKNVFPSCCRFSTYICLHSLQISATQHQLASWEAGGRLQGQRPRSTSPGSACTVRPWLRRKEKTQGVNGGSGSEFIDDSVSSWVLQCPSGESCRACRCPALRSLVWTLRHALVHRKRVITAPGR